MSDEPTADTTRRTFMKGVGLAAGGAALGLSSTGLASAAHPLNLEFANFRAREASKVWERGYRGRPDRSIGLTDSGIEARHPDLGPWNGVQATTANSELVLTDPGSDVGSRDRVKVGEEQSESATVGPGAFPAESETVVTEFSPTQGNVEEVDATLSWAPNGDASNDLEFRIDMETSDGGWEEVARTATASMPEKLNEVPVEKKNTYRFVAEQYVNTTTQATVTWTYHRYTGTLNTLSEDTVFEFLDEDGNPTGDGPHPKTIGWFNETSRYGGSDAPRDPDGHGSHCSSIMGGSGRASTLESATEESPQAVLTAGDTLEYEVSAEAGTGVFISAYGDAIELAIEDPDGREVGGRAVDSDVSTYDVAVAEAPAEQTGTYTIYVRAAGGQVASTGRCQRVLYGAFEDPEATDGDREGAANTLHAGMAPNASLVGLQGLSDPTVSLGEYAGEFASIFNMRAVNMSWGYVGGLPLGAAGGALGNIPATIKQIAKGGILTVAAAGNAATPANGNGAPGIADECISVAATDHSDGLVAYSSGGIGGIDEDDEGEYMKPDVSAPGGSLTDLVNAALAGNANEDESEQSAIRDYTGKAGTSMASPYTCGTAGLVSEAMEFDAPDQISLPVPEKTQMDDVMRLKQVILATASETAFTAAPYHRAHAPTYQNGGRDPYEGFGRINPDAAVDAVTRPLADGSDVGPKGTVDFSELESVGLNVPEDSRAVAGHVVAPDGTVDVDIEFSHYSGGNKGMAQENPHLDLFVYDAESPAINGEPNIVASTQALQGSGSVSLDVSGDDSDVYYVVAKIVNVPGAVNGFDIQTNFDLNVTYTAAAKPALSVGGSREDDGSVYTSGQTNTVKLTVESLPEGVSAVRVTDFVPDGWKVMPFGDYVSDSDAEDRDGIVVDLGTVTQSDIDGSGDANTVTYFAEPTGSTGQYTFGPGEATIVTGDVSKFRNETAEFTGEDTNTVVGASQSNLSL